MPLALFQHVASNPTTRYKPAPTPAQFAANADLVARAQIFLRREFLVWTGVDTEFMVTYVVGLMQTIDIRSDAAVRLLRDFLDVGTEQDGAEGGGRAEHFAHGASPLSLLARGRSLRWTRN